MGDKHTTQAQPRRRLQPIMPRFNVLYSCA
jgi:hypothetical protein